MADALTPEEQKFAQTVQSLRYLIADPTSSRTSFRKLLSFFMVKPSQVDIAETFAEAKTLLEAKKHQVVFTDQEIDGKGCLGVLELQRSLLAPGELQVFLLSSAKDAEVVTTGAAEENVDGLFLKPFNFGSLKTSFMQSMNRKLKPSPYDQAIRDGEIRFKEEKWDEALALFSKARTLDPKPALACSWEGRVYAKLEKWPEALHSFDQGLAIAPEHYRCLIGLLETLSLKGDHSRAYEVGRKLAQHHSIPMKQMPTLIRLSIQNQKFGDVLAFFKDADAMAQSDPMASTYLSAGLVVCGLHFLKKKEAQPALDAFRKAEVSARGNPRILRRIVFALAAEGLEAEKKAFMGRLPDEVKNSPEMLRADLDFLEKSGGSPAKVLEMGLSLIRQGIEDEHVYEVVIEKSKELGRKPEHLRELITAAAAKYPSLASKLDELS